MKYVYAVTLLWPQTPVYVATYMNQAAVVRKLMNYGADVNQMAHRGENAKGPLHCAASKGDAYVETLNTLLQSPHAQINKPNFDGEHCNNIAGQGRKSF